VTIEDLEAQLVAAREAQTTGREARAKLLEAERALAAARNEEYAEPIDFPVQWDVGAPMPHVVMNDYRCFLAFYLHEPESEASESLALVEFERCISAKLGAPNDEVLKGHPLYGRGADWYTAQRVRNSRWLAEIEKISSVHSQYRPETWRSLTHFIFWFHDTTFECIANSFKIERRSTSMPELLAEMTRRVVG
jgi:hypothetical protein